MIECYVHHCGIASIMSFPIVPPIGSLIFIEEHQNNDHNMFQVNKIVFHPNRIQPSLYCHSTIWQDEFNKTVYNIS